MTVAAKFKVGQKVQWKWVGRSVQGVVEEIHTESIEKTVKGKAIKRNGSVENPAILVLSQSGNHALKLSSELQPVTVTAKRLSPTMFK